MANLYIVHHNYDAEKSDELTLQVGDIINVSDNSDPGWWVGEKVKDGQAGWFPANFVDPHEEKPAAPAVAAPTAPADPVPAAPVEDDAVTAPATAESAAPPAPKHEGPVLARVEYDYEAKESGELSLEVGRVVTILDSSDPAWWTGDLNGKVGTFPSNYVKLLEHKEETADAGDKPAKFKLAAFGVKQGGLGSLFAGGVVPGLKKTGGLKKLGGVSEPAAPAPAPAPAVGGMAKRTSVDEPRSPVVAAAPPKISPPVAEEVVAPLIAHHTPARATPPAPTPATPPAPVEEPVAAQEPRVPSRAKKPKSKQIRALVVYDYAAQEDDEITLVKGSTIVVTDKMGDEGWWSGRNEDGEVGNFPSDFVEEIKEEAVQSPRVAPAAPVPIPAPIAVPAPAPAPAPVAQEEAPKSPVQSRPPIHAPVPLPAVPAVPAEPLRVEPVRTRTNESPMATPPAFPRGSRPPSMISSPTPSSAQLHDVRTPIDGPPLPSSPPPKRMSTISRTSSRDVPGSPRLASIPVFPNPEASSPTSTQPPAGDLSRSSTLRRPQKPVPEAPLTEGEEISEGHVAETPEPPTSNSNRNSYILPTPVARNRPLPPLARPPSIHSITENRRSIASPPVSYLPPVPSEAEEPEPVHEEIVEEEEVEDHAPEAPVHEEETMGHQEEPEEPVPSQEAHNEAEQEEEPATEAAAVEEPVEEEKEPEKPKLPEFESTGPALSHVSRPRPAKGRKPPTAPVPAETSSFVAQLEAEVKAAPAEEVKPAPVPVVEKAAPPPKPVKPIFQKFPTPFAGAQPASISLRPTGRRTESANDGPLSPVNSSSSSAGSPANAPTPAGGVAPPAGGVKSLSSRFGQFQGVPASGGTSAALELEIAKLRRWMTEELDRVKKELSDEREAREKLQEEVDQLKSQLQG